MRVADDMQFDGPRALDRVGPAIAERAEQFPGGIQDARGVGYMPARAARGGPGHMGKQVCKQARRPFGIGIGQARARHGASAHMIEPE